MFEFFTLLQNLLSFFQKTCLPELQFLSQKSLQHSHFLCIVMCAVLYKSKFSNSATHKFSFKFFLHYCKTFYHFFKKHGCLNCSFCSKKVCNTAIFCVLLQCAPYFVSEDFPISLHAKCRWLFPVGHFYKNILNIGATIRLFLLCTISATKANFKCEKNRGNLCLISVCKHLLLCYNIFTTEKNCG